MLERHLLEIGIEFFGQYHRHRRIDSLAHLDLRHHQRGLAGGINADEGVGREFADGHVRRLYRLVHRADGKVKREQESACQAAGQQRAARNFAGNCLGNCHGAALTTGVRKPPV